MPEDNRAPEPPGLDDAGAPLWRRTALVVAMFLITASFGFLQPFVPLYLQASGLSHGLIGAVVGIGSGAALLVQPLLGRLSDRLDARRPLMACAALSAALAYWSYGWVSSAIGFTVLTAVGVNATMYLNAAAGALIGRMAGKSRGGRAYASYRVWGSVGYIVVSLLSGWLLHRGGVSNALTRTGLAPVFAWGPCIFIAVAGAVLLAPDPRSRVVRRSEGFAAQRPLGEATLRAFLPTFFLYQFALYGASAYLSLYMKHLGAGPAWITGMFAAGVVCEVLVMMQIGTLADRHGRKPILAVAYIVMPVRLLMYIPATGPAWVLGVQLLHGLNFGIMGAVAVVFVNDLADDHARGAAQARLAAAGGLATALGPAACGLLAQYAGMQGMFAAMSLVGALGAWLFITRVGESHPGWLAGADSRALGGRADVG